VVLVERSDESLVVAAAQQPDAFAALYRRYEGPILGYLVRRVPSAELAADLLAEVFAAALAAIRDGAAPADAWAPWLFGIARHKLADSYRRGQVEDAARRRVAMSPVALTDDDIDRINALRTQPEVLDWVDELPADQRDAVLARVVAERDYAEIATELACSEQVVRKRVSRGLAGLRARMDATR
jgi:RNA polymerase sigma factor (sigma-70 family)